MVPNVKSKKLPLLVKRHLRGEGGGNGMLCGASLVVPVLFNIVATY